MRVLLCIYLLIPLAVVSTAPLAAMSIDLGSQFLKAGIIKPGVPMEIILNKESRRKTSTLLSIRNGEKLVGDAAAKLSTRYPQSVYPFLVDLLASYADSPTVNRYKERFPYSPLILQENNTVCFSAEDREYSVESLLAMILSSTREEAEVFSGQPVHDVVIAVPAYFSQAERLAVLAAARVAGLSCLQLVNGGTAAALSWAALNRKDVDGKTIKMAVYDVGASGTTCTVVEFSPDEKKQTRLRVLATDFDRGLGGLEMTHRLAQHLASRWMEANPGLDQPLQSNSKALAKLHSEAERLKLVLSANTEHVAQVESLHEGRDLRMKVTRSEFESLLTPLIPRFTAPFIHSVAAANIRLEELDYVVLMGGATRTPVIQASLQQESSKPLGRFLNTDEAIAMGALFLAADKSKGFKVKPLPVVDAVLFPFVAHYPSTSGEGFEHSHGECKLFERGASIPSSGQCSFPVFREDFIFNVSYSNLQASHSESVWDPSLLSVRVSGMEKAQKEAAEGEEWKEVNVRFRVDDSGILRILAAEVQIIRPRSTLQVISDKISGFFGEDEKRIDIENEEEEEEGERREKKQEASESRSGNVAVNTSAQADVMIKEGLVKVKLQLKKRFIGRPVPTKEEMRHSAQLLEDWKEKERSAAAREVAHNSLETRLYDTNLLLQDNQFIAASKPSERDSIQDKLSQIREWLELVVQVETKIEEFSERERALKKMTRKVQTRIYERKEVVTELKRMHVIFSKVNTLVHDKIDVGDKEDLEKMKEKLEENKKWMEDKERELEQLPLHVDLSASSKEVSRKTDLLRNAGRRFKAKLNKSKHGIVGEDNERVSETRENESHKRKGEEDRSSEGTDEGHSKVEL